MQCSRRGQTLGFCSEIVQFSDLSVILFLLDPNTQFRALQLSPVIENMFP